MAMPSKRRTGPPAAVPAAAWQHAAVMLVAAACLLVAVSFRIFDTDLWQHLVRAKAMLALRTIPHQQIWTWPMYGTPERNAAWGFALLLWPFWSHGGVIGLFAWRGLAVLAAFGIAWAVARRLGARGLAAPVVIVACAMVYRQRSQVRPETLAVILLGAILWILETRRQGGRDHAAWIVPLAWLWPNVHVSYYLGWLVLALFAADELLGGAGKAGRGTRRASLLWVGIAAVAVSFLNPFGVAALESPLEFLLRLRREPLYQAIGELQPIDWTLNLRNGLPLLMLAWPALQIWRWRRGRPDRVEAALWAVFTAEALTAQRFVVFWTVVAAPYLARGLAEWLAARRMPDWGRAPGRRAALAACACAGLTVAECSRGDLPLGLTIDPTSFPGPACDFMASTGVRGHGFNYFEQGGYLLWRFWPDRDRLPFMTTIPELSTPEIRLAYQRAMLFEDDWRRMDQRYRFDYALLKRVRQPGDRYLDFLDADSSFALVFEDDVSALYVRRDGPLRAVAERHGYRWLAGGQVRLDAIGAEMVKSPEARRQMRLELDRAIRSSPLHSSLDRVRAALLALDAAPSR